MCVCVCVCVCVCGEYHHSSFLRHPTGKRKFLRNGQPVAVTSHQVSIRVCVRPEPTGKVTPRGRFPKAHQLHQPQTQYSTPSGLHPLGHSMIYDLTWLPSEDMDRLFPHLWLQFTTSLSQAASVSSLSPNGLISFSFPCRTCSRSDPWQLSL